MAVGRMPSMPAGRAIPLTFVVISTMLGMSAIAYLLWQRSHEVAHENHLLEWTQVVFLLGAAATHAFHLRTSFAAASHHVRLVLALLCFSFAVREVDIDELSPVSLMPEIELAVRLVVLAAWLIVAWRTIRALDVLWTDRCQIWLSRIAIISIAGCALYVASAPFDKHPLWFGSRATSRFIEETIQLNATYLLLIAAWCSSPLR